MSKHTTPLRAIGGYCKECVGEGYPVPRGIEAPKVRDCAGDKCKNGDCDKHGVCFFYPYRLGKGRPSVKVIRARCLSCMGGSHDLVRDCWTPECDLYDFRMGTNPNRAMPEKTVQKQHVRGGFEGQNRRSAGHSSMNTPSEKNDKKTKKTALSKANRRPCSNTPPKKKREGVAA